MDLSFEYKCEKIPTINHTYVKGKDCFFKKNEVVVYQRGLGVVAMIAVRRAKKSFFNKERLEVSLRFEVQNINRDLDNMIKATLDSLQGIVFRNDKQVFKIQCEKVQSKENYETLFVKIGEIKED